MENLSTLRAKAGLSVTELARRAGVNAGSISRIERGMQSPSLATALRIATVLEVDVAEINFVGRND